MTMPRVDPTELRFVGAAEVHKRGRLAGRLVREAAGVRFQYDQEYLDDPDAPAVATTLPRTTEPTITPAGAVPPFFAGLLPEGRRLGALRRAVKTSADDELSLLLAVGRDTIGDVEVLPAGYEPEPARPGVEVASWSDVSFADLYTDMTGERLVRPRAGLAGVQPKVSAEVVSLPVRRAGERFILKLDPPELPHLVANEAFFLDAARRSGLTVAEAEVVHDRDGAPGLLVRRFDRTVQDGAVIALAQEDACQVLDRYPADKYSVATEAVVDALARTTGAPIVAARDLVRQFAFAYLTANGDAHAKNFSIVQRLDGEWHVSPAYDLPSTQPYGDHTTALLIEAKTDERIGRADFVALGARTGVPARATEKLLDELVERVELWLPSLDTLPFDARTTHKLRRAIEYRRDRLATRP
jgi:serine/threonine-protein kinase HipA